MSRYISKHRAVYLLVAAPLGSVPPVGPGRTRAAPCSWRSSTPRPVEAAPLVHRSRGPAGPSPLLGLTCSSPAIAARTCRAGAPSAA
jgi:hypothetical protein